MTTPGNRSSTRPPARARDDAFVADISHLVVPSGWPDGTVLIVRRERRNPGAQHAASGF